MNERKNNCSVHMTSVRISTEILKKIKLYAIEHDMKIYEVIEKAVEQLVKAG